MEDYSYIGVGRIYLRQLGAAGGLIEVGNCSALGIGITEEEKKLRDYTTPGGGTRNSVKRIDAVQASFTMHDINAPNLARVLYGAATTEAAGGTVTGEAFDAYPGAFYSFEYLSATTPAPTLVGGVGATARDNTEAYALGELVTPATPNGFFYVATVGGTSGGTVPVFPTTIGATVVDGTVTWTNAGRTVPVEGEDYEQRAGGVLILEGRTLAGMPYSVSYTRAGADVVEALVNSGQEFEMIFDGLNEARSGKRTKITAFRVKPGAAQNLGLIAEEYGELAVTAEVLQDSSRSGVGLSRYFRIQMEQ
jgi:hypothetical protein